MKILIFGSSIPYALESFYKRHLQEQSHEVIIFSGSDYFHHYYQVSVLNKIKFRLGISSIHKNINNELIRELERYSPNVLLVFKGMELYPETINAIQKTGIYTVNYNPDHPFIFHGRGSGNKNVIKSIPFYNLHISYSLEIKEEMEDIYNVICDWLPFGFEPSNIAFSTENEEIKRLCFIGFADKQRTDIINQLINAEIPVDVYGPNWNNFLNPSQYLQIFPAVYNDAFDKTAIKYRVQLNLFRPHNDNSHNMRSFEMTGIGCIMLAPDSKEHRLFFEDKKEVFLFNSSEELIRLAKEILALSFNDCIIIRNSVLKKSHQYSYAHRAQQLVNIILKYQKHQ
jgi:hypothetical protein